MTAAFDEFRSIVRASFAYHMWSTIGSLAGIPVYIRTKPFRAIGLFAFLQTGCLVVSEIGRRVDPEHYLTLGLAETTVFMFYFFFVATLAGPLNIPGLQRARSRYLALMLKAKTRRSSNSPKHKEAQ